MTNRRCAETALTNRMTRAHRYEKHWRKGQTGKQRTPQTMQPSSTVQGISTHTHTRTGDVPQEVKSWSWGAINHWARPRWHRRAVTCEHTHVQFKRCTSTDLHTQGGKHNVVKSSIKGHCSRSALSAQRWCEPT